MEMAFGKVVRSQLASHVGVSAVWIELFSEEIENFALRCPWN